MAGTSEPRWLSREVVVALHDESLTLFGGGEGIRDEGLLESALARPRQRWSFDPDVTIPELAAHYGLGLVRNHAFVDGNKRIGLLATAVFLRINGFEFRPEEADEVAHVLGVAAGEIDDDAFVEWVRLHAVAQAP